MIYEKVRRHKKMLTWFTVVFVAVLVLIALFLSSYYLVLIYPIDQVSQLEINNVSEKADLINKYRTTSIQLITAFAQIFGGITVGIGIIFAWGNLKNAREGQITERFTRAIDQLGNKNIEIRLGGIYALERIANESDKDYWPIMEILTAYVRKNSSVEVVKNKKNTTTSMGVQDNESKKKDVSEIRKLPFDIQAVLTVIGRRKYAYNNGESNKLNLSNTYLNRAEIAGANLNGANLEGTYLEETNLTGVNLNGANLEGANFKGAHFKGAKLLGANLLGANLEEANLIKANLWGANLNNANLNRAYLDEACLTGAKFSGAKLERAQLKGANLNASFLETSLVVAQLEGTKLEGAYRGGAYLGYAHLADAYLVGANLNEATLWKANLERANLRDANLKRAHLEGAHLEGAQLEGANLIGAYGLSFDQLSKVETLYDTKLDDDLLIQLKEKCPALFKKPDQHVHKF